MNRSVTALFAALEALLVVGAGLGVPLVLLTLLWAFQYDLSVDWSVFYRLAADAWLLGHGVDIRVDLDATFSASLGLPSETIFPVTIALLGFALVTLLLGVRAGRRIAETRFRQFGLTISTLVFAALSLVITLTAASPAGLPSRWQGVILPTAIFFVGGAIGSEVGRRRRAADIVDEVGSSLRDAYADLPTPVRSVLRIAATGGVASVAVVLAVASVLVAVLLAVDYSQIIGLFETLQAGALGGAALTATQLAILPNAVIWAASWLVGPGFAIGAGSAVTPLGTQLGPLPALPILGAIPAGQLAFGFVGLIVPLAAAFLVASQLRRRLVATLAEDATLPRLLIAGVGMGVMGGIAFGLLAWASAGAAGPGRLIEVGPNPLLVGAFAALEIGVASVIAMITGPRLSR
jgi:hypothetical protein